MYDDEECGQQVAEAADGSHEVPPGGRLTARRHSAECRVYATRSTNMARRLRCAYFLADLAIAALETVLDGVCFSQRRRS
jgi:hypothetical protein